MTAPGVQPRTANEEFAARRQHLGQRIQHFVHGHPWASPLVILIVSVAVFSVLSPQFGTAGNLSLVAQQATVLAAVSAGQVLVLLSGGVDLSVGAVTVLTTFVVGKLAADMGAPGIVALVAGLVAGAALGMVNGFLVAFLKLNPFIVTLGTLSVFTALITLISQGQIVEGSELDWLITLTAQSFIIGGFTVTVGMIVVTVLYLLLAYALLQTAWGRHVFAVGDDAEVSRLLAIRVRRVRLSVYVVAGMIMAVAGWVLIGRTGAVSPQSALSINLDSITAVVIGGTGLAGGRGSIVGAVLGSLVVAVFRNGLFLAGVPALFQDLSVGVLIVVAVTLDMWIRRVRA